MANGDAPKKRDGSNFIAAAVAVLAVALFLGWLMTREEPEAVQVAEETPADTTGSGADGAATAVTAAELNSSARVNELRGQDVRIDDAEVVSAMGPQLFWIQLPGGSPFLIKLDSALVASGTQAPATGHYTIVGRVLEKPGTLLDQWMSSGVLRNDNDKLQAEFGTSYIEARRIRPVGS